MSLWFVWTLRVLGIWILIMREPYFRYFPAPPEISTWGLGIVGAGVASVAPGQPYPPIEHPTDHAFTWEHGRVLESMQILVITRGRGSFETRDAGLCRVNENSAFVLLPGVWHRYRPDPETGWDESWCELRGPVVEQLLRDRILRPDDPLRAGAFSSGLVETLDTIHRRVRGKTHPGFDPQLSALALQSLALWSEMERKAAEPAQALQAVTRAERYIAEHLSEPINLEELARKEGIAYSHFRRLFRSCTGYSPWQYILHLRLEMARRMLAGSDAKLRDVAANLGFSSAFHFSSAFKNAYGTSPTEWRREIKKGGGPAAQPET